MIVFKKHQFTHPVPNQVTLLMQGYLISTATILWLPRVTVKRWCKRALLENSPAKVHVFRGYLEEASHISVHAPQLSVNSFVRSFPHCHLPWSYDHYDCFKVGKKLDSFPAASPSQYVQVDSKSSTENNERRCGKTARQTHSFMIIKSLMIEHQILRVLLMRPNANICCVIVFQANQKAHLLLRWCYWMGRRLHEINCYEPVDKYLANFDPLAAGSESVFKGFTTPDDAYTTELLGKIHTSVYSSCGCDDTLLCEWKVAQSCLDNLNILSIVAQYIVRLWSIWACSENVWSAESNILLQRFSDSCGCSWLLLALLHCNQLSAKGSLLGLTDQRWPWWSNCMLLQIL